MLRIHQGSSMKKQFGHVGSIVRWHPRLSTILVLMFLACTAFGQDFRLANWGISDDDVKRLEGSDCERQSDQKIPEEFHLDYDREMLGRSIRVIYDFDTSFRFLSTAPRLVLGIIFFDREDSPPNSDIQIGLTKKYGEPKEKSDTEDRVRWIWKTSRTRIVAIFDKNGTEKAYIESAWWQENNKKKKRLEEF